MCCHPCLVRSWLGLDARGDNLYLAVASREQARKWKYVITNLPAGRGFSTLRRRGTACPPERSPIATASELSRSAPDTGVGTPRSYEAQRAIFLKRELFSRLGPHAKHRHTAGPAGGGGAPSTPRCSSHHRRRLAVDHFAEPVCQSNLRNLRRLEDKRLGLPPT